MFVLTWRDGVLALAIPTFLGSLCLTGSFLLTAAPLGVAFFGLVTLAAAAVIHLVPDD